MRLFVAIEPPCALRGWVAEATRRLEPLASGLRWVPPANAHLTLAFLGEQPAGRLEPLREAIRRAAARPAFGLGFGGLGAFDSWRRARVVWLGVTDGAEELRALAAALKDGLERGGFPVEKREFSAHLTLARAREPRALKALEGAALASPAAIQVRELSLMRSHLDPKGARYEALWRCALSEVEGLPKRG